MTIPRTTSTPHKFRSVADATIPNFVALLKERLAKINAHLWQHFELPRNATLLIDPPRDGYGPRLHIFHDGLEVVLSLRPGTQVTTPASLLLPQVFRDIQQTDVIKVLWRHAKRAKAPR